MLYLNQLWQLLFLNHLKSKNLKYYSTQVPKVGKIATSRGEVEYALTNHGVYRDLASHSNLSPNEYFINLIKHLFGMIKANNLYIITDPTEVRHEKNRRLNVSQPGHIWGVISDSNAEVLVVTHTDFSGKAKPDKIENNKTEFNEILYNAQLGMSYKDTDIDTADSVQQLFRQGVWNTHSGRAKKDEITLKKSISEEPFSIVSIPYESTEIDQVIKNIRDYLDPEDFEKLRHNQAKFIEIPAAKNYYILTGGKLPSGEHVEPFNCGTLLLKIMHPKVIHSDNQFLHMKEEEHKKHLFRLSPPGVLSMFIDLLAGQKAAAQLVNALAQDEKFRICFEYTSHCKKYLTKQNDNDFQPKQ